MADNIAITAGAGTSIAADDISSVFYQRVKVSVGADGSATDLSSTNPMPVMGSVVRIDTEFTRPADTTSYSANDVVSNSTSSTTLIDLASAVRANGASGYIVAARLFTDKKSITPKFRVHFFNASNPTVSVDNANMRLLYADVAKYLGYVDLAAMATGKDTTNSTMSFSANSAVRLPVVAGGATRSIYAVLETLDNFAPASGQKFTLSIFIDNN